MKLIGITGGVGAGKSEVLNYLENNYMAKIVLADEVAHELMLPHQPCYDEIIQAFPKLDLIEPDGRFSKKALSELVFSDEKNRERINSLVHPAVKVEIKRRIAQAKNLHQISYFVIEAALLIQDGYDTICDELWYIYADEEIRRDRLRRNRNYTDDRISRIFASQLSDGEYRKHCKYTIDNGGERQDTYRQIDEIMQQ
ncbi:MAG: dephospho-CoA kinase [Lachnospiraceae bacterium]